MPPLDIDAILRMILGGQSLVPLPSPPAGLAGQLPSVPLTLPQPALPTLPFEPAALAMQMAAQAPPAPPPVLDVGQALAQLGRQALTPPPTPQVDTSALPGRPNALGSALGLAGSLQGLRPPVSDPFGLGRAAAQTVAGLMGTMADIAIAPTVQQALTPPLSEETVYQLIKTYWPNVRDTEARAAARRLADLAAQLYPGDRKSQVSFVDAVVQSGLFLPPAAGQEGAAQGQQAPAPPQAPPPAEAQTAPARERARPPEPPASLKQRAKRDPEAKRYLTIFNAYIKKGDLEELDHLVSWAWAQDDPAIRQWGDAIAIWARERR